MISRGSSHGGIGAFRDGTIEHGEFLAHVRVELVHRPDGVAENYDPKMCPRHQHSNVPGVTQQFGAINKDRLPGLRNGDAAGQVLHGIGRADFGNDVVNGVGRAEVIARFIEFHDADAEGAGIDFVFKECAAAVLVVFFDPRGRQIEARKAAAVIDEFHGGHGALVAPF